MVTRQSIFRLSVFVFSLLLSACAQLGHSLKNKSDLYVADSAQQYLRSIPQTELFNIPLPVSPEIIQGQLDNGVRYIIRENKTPENFAELRLLVAAGSLQEDESQLGFAHFAEHMAFNGTEDFEKQEIIEYIESIGMRFGPHLNAFTSFDNTLYKLRIPTDKQDTLEKGIHILENWAHKISFNPDTIDAERGVVLEEWRGRKGAQERIYNQRLPVMLAGSQYAERLPIGSEDIILNGKYEDLERYYKTWYRPDLMSIVAVGDFDAKQVERFIIKYFAQLQKEEDAINKLPQSLTELSAPAYSIVTDPEITQASVSIDYRLPISSMTTIGDLRETNIEQLALSIINARFQEASWKQSAPFTFAGVRLVNNFTLGRNFNLSFGPKPNQYNEAYALVLKNLHKIAKQGPTAAELSKQKQIFSDNFASAIAQKSTINHDFYVAQYKSYFEEDAALVGLEQAYKIIGLYLDKVTPSDIQEKIAQWISKNDAVISITAPQNVKDEIPSESILNDLWLSSKVDTGEAYVAQEDIDTLMNHTPAPGTIIEKAFHEEWQAHIWTLSNGAKVLLKQNNYQENTMRLWARSDGGFALVDDATYLRSYGLMSSVDAFGIGDLNIEQLNNFMQGKRFDVSAKITAYSEELYGETDQNSIEQFMQLLHLKFVGARKDQARFDWLKGLYRPQIEQSMNNPNFHFSNAIQDAMNTGNPRIAKFDLQALENQNLDDIYEIRTRSFSNAADFLFVIVGDIDLNTMEDMLRTYIATLPSSEQRDSLNPLPEYEQDNWVEVNVSRGSEPKATVAMHYSGDANWSHKSNLVFDALIASLDNKLRSRLREELAGVYSVNVSGNVSRWPYQNYAISISFTCNPDRIDELRKEVEQVFADFIAGNIEEQALINFKTQLLLNREKRLKENSFWVGYIMNSMSPLAPMPLNEFAPAVNNITLNDVKQAAKTYLVKRNGYFATLTPELATSEGDQ